VHVREWVGVERVDLGFHVVTPTAKATAKQLCMQDTVSILNLQCLTVVQKPFQDREKANKLQDTSHKELRLRLHNCDYDTKSSTDTIRNNEHKTVMHETR
jgi:hypothetical protein